MVKENFPDDLTKIIAQKNKDQLAFIEEMTLIREEWEKVVNHKKGVVNKKMFARWC